MEVCTKVYKSYQHYFHTCPFGLAGVETMDSNFVPQSVGHRTGSAGITTPSSHTVTLADHYLSWGQARQPKLGRS